MEVLTTKKEAKTAKPFKTVDAERLEKISYANLHQVVTNTTQTLKTQEV